MLLVRSVLTLAAALLLAAACVLGFLSGLTLHSSLAFGGSLRATLLAATFATALTSLFVTGKLFDKPAADLLPIVKLISVCFLAGFFVEALPILEGHALAAAGLLIGTYGWRVAKQLRRSSRTKAEDR